MSSNTTNQPDPKELIQTSDVDGENIKADFPKIPETRVTTTSDARTMIGLLSRKTRYSAMLELSSKTKEGKIQND